MSFIFISSSKYGISKRTIILIYILIINASLNKFKEVRTNLISAVKLDFL